MPNIFKKFRHSSTKPLAIAFTFWTFSVYKLGLLFGKIKNTIGRYQIRSLLVSFFYLILEQGESPLNIYSRIYYIKKKFLLFFFFVSSKAQKAAFIRVTADIIQQG